MDKTLVSIIIPTLNEEKIIQKCLLQFINQTPPLEIIVVDGGSSDKTREIIKEFRFVKLIKAKAGRSIQMNTGARIAQGRILLFLHADTFLPDNGVNLIRQAVKKNKAIGGFFGLKHDEQPLNYRLFSFLINIRSNFTIVPYGDQAVFCLREAFEKINGFKQMPIMEDYDFSLCLKKLGKLIRVNEKVTTSFRRYKKGILLYSLQCNLITLLYYLRVPAKLLKKLYKDVR